MKDASLRPLQEEARNLAVKLDRESCVTCDCGRCVTNMAGSIESLLARSREEAVVERTAQIAAHRVCCGNEHDGISKFHGYCVVCGIPWPCEYAGTPPTARPKTEEK